MKPAPVLLVVVLLLGCSSQPAEPAHPAPSPAQPAATQQEPPAAQPAPEVPAAQPQKAEAPKKEPAKAAAKPQEPPRPAPEKPILLAGAPMGGVKFQHSSHSLAQGIQCETCHHPSRPEKPNTTAQQACRSCHTPLALPPMKTKLQAAFHNPAGNAGLCLDCHKQSAAQGKNAPTKCLQCHKKENG